jgi:hypothetical protein
LSLKNNITLLPIIFWLAINFLQILHRLLQAKDIHTFISLLSGFHIPLVDFPSLSARVIFLRLAIVFHSAPSCICPLVHIWSLRWIGLLFPIGLFIEIGYVLWSYFSLDYSLILSILSRLYPMIWLTLSCNISIREGTFSGWPPFWWLTNSL